MSSRGGIWNIQSTIKVPSQCTEYYFCCDWSQLLMVLFYQFCLLRAKLVVNRQSVLVHHGRECHCHFSSLMWLSSPRVKMFIQLINCFFEVGQRLSYKDAKLSWILGSHQPKRMQFLQKAPFSNSKWTKPLYLSSQLCWNCHCHPAKVLLGKWYSFPGTKLLSRTKSLVFVPSASLLDQGFLKILLGGFLLMAAEPHIYCPRNCLSLPLSLLVWSHACLRHVFRLSVLFIICILVWLVVTDHSVVHTVTFSIKK